MSTLIASMPVRPTTATPAVASPPRISQIAEDRLRSSSYWAVRTISCAYHDGVLILRGRVSAYYLKQLAQEAVAELDGVLEIANQIQVVRPDKPAGGDSSPDDVLFG